MQNLGGLCGGFPFEAEIEGFLLVVFMWRHIKPKFIALTTAMLVSTPHIGWYLKHNVLFRLYHDTKLQTSDKNISTYTWVKFEILLWCKSTIITHFFPYHAFYNKKETKNKIMRVWLRIAQCKACLTWQCVHLAGTARKIQSKRNIIGSVCTETPCHRRKFSVTDYHSFICFYALSCLSCLGLLYRECRRKSGP